MVFQVFTWTIPPKAWGLYVLMLFGLASLGMTAGSWIIPVLAGAVHAGVAGIAELEPADRIFGQLPRWLNTNGFPYYALGILHVTCLITGLGLLGTLGNRLWRQLVVKLHWMTDEEVDQFFKRQKSFP